MTDVEAKKNTGPTETEPSQGDLVSAQLTAVHQVLSHLDDDDLVIGDEAATAQTISLDAQRAPAAPTSPAGPDKEDSIEDYMAALLARSQGSAYTPSDQGPSNPSIILDEEEVAEPVVEEESPQRTMEEMAQRRQQAQSEVRNNLSSMRELANMSSRTAIETHNCKQFVQRSFIHLGLTAAGLTLSFCAIPNITTLTSLPFGLAAFGTLLAAFGGTQFFRITSRLRKIPQAIQPVQIDES